MRYRACVYLLMSLVLSLAQSTHVIASEAKSELIAQAPGASMPSNATPAAVSANTDPTAARSGTKPKKSIQLTGRIEQLTNEASPSLPNSVGRTAPDIAGGLQRGAIAGFPSGFLGRWVGPVVVERNDYGELRTRDPELYSRECGIMFPGRQGLGQVIFSQVGDKVKAISTVAEFTQIPNDLKYMDKVQTILPNTHFDILFGAAQNNSTTIVGAEQSSRVTLDRITELEAANFEQQIATSNQIVNRARNTVSYGTTEVVLRFHQLNPNQMIVDMAQVMYSGRGAFDSKLIVHGTFSRQSQSR